VDGAPFGSHTPRPQRLNARNLDPVFKVHTKRARVSSDFTILAHCDAIDLRSLAVFGPTTAPEFEDFDDLQ
jgi:hypothetical protein